MNRQTNPLDQLPPVMLPEAIGWWPLAMGWWLVIAFSIVAILAISIYCTRRYKSKALKRAAIAEGLQLYKQYLQTNNTHCYITQYNQLLRRFCLQQFPNVSSASLSGEAWLQQLDTLAEKTLFQSATGKQLLSIYQPNADKDIDIAELHSLLKQWLNQVKLKQSARDKVISQ